MANNRMWIECPPCGERHMIAKHFGGAWETRAYAGGEIVGHAEFTAQLNEWLQEHTWCDPKSVGSHLRLIYEVPAEGRGGET